MIKRLPCWPIGKNDKKPNASKTDTRLGWFIVLGSFFVQLLIDGTMSAFGIIYEAIQNDTEIVQSNYSKTLLSMPGAIQPGTFLTAGIFAGPLIQCFGFRVMGFIGTLLASGGLALASLQTNMYIFGLFYGFVTGAGFAILFVCAIVTVNFHFNRLRPLASGLAMSGSGFGYLLVPFLLDWINSRLDWRNVLLVWSLLTLIIYSLSVATFKPFYLHSPGENGEDELKLSSHDHELVSPHQDQDFNRTSDFVAIQDGLGNHKQAYHENLNANDSMPESRLWNSSLGFDHRPVEVGNESVNLTRSFVHQRTPELSPVQSRTPSSLGPADRVDAFYPNKVDLIHDPNDLSTKDYNLANGSLDRPNTDMESATNKLVDDNATTQMSTNQRRDRLSSIRSIAMRLVKLLDLGLYYQPSFVYYLSSAFCMQLGYFIPFVYLIEFCKEQGIASDQAVLLLIIIGLLHSLGRIAAGLVGNLSWVNLTCLSGAGFLTAGLTHLLIANILPSSFAWYSFYAGLFGFTSGVPMPIMSLILVEYLGLERLTAAISNLNLVKGIAAVIGPILAVFVVEKTGNTANYFNTAATCWILSGLFHIPLYYSTTCKCPSFCQFKTKSGSSCEPDDDLPNEVVVSKL